MFEPENGAAVSGALEDAARLGLDPAQTETLRASLARMRGGGGAESFAGVWPENIPTVEAFLSVQTQWRTVQLNTATEARS